MTSVFEMSQRSYRQSSLSTGKLETKRKYFERQRLAEVFFLFSVHSADKKKQHHVMSAINIV